MKGGEVDSVVLAVHTTFGGDQLVFQYPCAKTGGNFTDPFFSIDNGYHLSFKS